MLWPPTAPESPSFARRPSQFLLWAAALLLAILLLELRPDGKPSPQKRAPQEQGRTVQATLPEQDRPELNLDHATESLLEVIIQLESQGDPSRQGSKGERGLMQIREGTWREVTTTHFGEAISFDRAFEPQLNRQVGRLYLGDLQVFLYEHRDDWQGDLRSLLLGAYNAGPQRLERAAFRIERLPGSTRSYIERGNSLHDWYLQEQAELLQPLLQP